MLTYICTIERSSIMALLKNNINIQYKCTYHPKVSDKRNLVVTAVSFVMQLRHHQLKAECALTLPINPNLPLIWSLSRVWLRRRVYCYCAIALMLRRGSRLYGPTNDMRPRDRNRFAHYVTVFVAAHAYRYCASNNNNNNNNFIHVQKKNYIQIKLAFHVAFVR